MPHSTQLPNGDSATIPKSTSIFLHHLTSYPVIHDLLSTLQTHPLTAKPLHFSADLYHRFAAPLGPYFQTPYAYAQPYVSRADELADEGLNQVDSRFPIVKKDTDHVVQQGREILGMPLKYAGEGRDYVVEVYNDEYTKTAKSASHPHPIQTSLLALLSTELKLATDLFQRVAEILGPRIEASKKKAKQAADDADKKASGNGSVGDDLDDAAAKTKKSAEQGLQSAREKGEEVKDEAKKQVGQ